MKQKPHIVIFNPDSYRGDVLGHLGNPGAVTPALDAFVEEGAVSFANAFSQSPVCTPSRCSFMTGWYPHTHGHRSMKNMLKPHEPNLLKVLQGEGYHVWWGGKNDFVSVETKDDFFRHCDEKFSGNTVFRGYRPPKLEKDDPRQGVFYRGVMVPDAECEYSDNDRACVAGAIEKIASRPENKPLCLYLPLSGPHPAYCVEQEFYDQIDPAALPPRLPVPENDSRHPPVLEALRGAYGSDRVDEAGWKEVKHVYYGMCAKIDHLFGRVVGALKNAGIYEDTLIVFLSDHGDFAGDYSLPEKTHSTLQDALLHVPLIMKLPAGMVSEHGIRRSLVELVDFSQTLYDILDINPGYECQGRSLRASLAGSDEVLHDAVFAEVGSRMGENRLRNTDAPKMAPGSFYAKQSGATRSFLEQGTYAVMCRTENYKYVRRAYMDEDELYDLQNDPGELNNRCGDPRLADVEGRMESRLLDYFMRTGDVLPHKQDLRKV